MRRIGVFLIMICVLGAASGRAQMPDTLKPAPDSAAGDTLAKKNYVLCPKCGRANLPEANYCIYCGEPLKKGLVRKVEVKPETPKQRGDPHCTRLFIVPTAETLKKGTGYLGDAEIFFLQGGIGLVEGLTLFGGSTLIPGNIDWQVVAGGPKIRIFKRGATSIAVGAAGAFNPHFNVVPWVVYGVATMGPTTGRLNLGVGKFGAGFGGSTPWLFSIGGEAGKSNRSRWLWESWVWKYDRTELVWDSTGYSYYDRKVGTKLAFPTCLGLRFFGENISGDLGLVYIWTSEGGTGMQVGFPLVSVIYHFK